MKELDEATTYRLMKAINLIFELANIQEGLAKDLESYGIKLNFYKFNAKQRINEIQRSSSKLREMATTTLNLQDKIDLYNIHSDRLQEVIFTECEIM